jgi:photosystem II stability/assembly factor-like uncharacterized protein
LDIPIILTLVIDPQTTATLYAGTIGGAFKSVDGGGHWSAVNKGLPATSIHALAVDPSAPDTVFAGADSQTKSGEVSAPGDTPAPKFGGSGGLYKSTDGGKTWRAIDTGMPSLDVLDLALDPATPAILYAGTLQGLLKSIDSGDTWNTVMLVADSISITALAIDPNTPATLYAGTPSGAFKSTNSGKTWSAVNAGLG